MGVRTEDAPTSVVKQYTFGDNGHSWYVPISEKVWDHPINERWGGERIELASVLRGCIECLQKEVKGMPTIQLDEIGSIGTYPNGAPNVTVRMNNSMWGSYKEWLGIVANLETTDHVIGLMEILQQSGLEKVMMATAFLACQLNEREAVNSSGQFELPMFKRMAQTLGEGNIIKGLLMLDAHSPATTWWLLKHNIVPIDLTTLPAMIMAAKKENWLVGSGWFCLSCDDGARSRGLFTVDVLGNSKGHIQGEKIKLDGVKIVVFKDEDLIKLKGQDVLICEDEVVSGGTLRKTIEQLLAAGVRRVVILAPYGELISGSLTDLNALGATGRVKLMISDGIKPKSCIKGLDYIQVMPLSTKDILNRVMDLMRKGVDLYSDVGRKELLNIGVALNPWQTYFD